MRAAFFIGTISAMAAQALLAIELQRPSALVTLRSDEMDALSLTQVDSKVTFGKWLNSYAQNPHEDIKTVFDSLKNLKLAYDKAFNDQAITLEKLKQGGSALGNEKEMQEIAKHYATLVKLLRYDKFSIEARDVRHNNRLWWYNDIKSLYDDIPDSSNYDVNRYVEYV